jgi:hypothetical protein
MRYLRNLVATSLSASLLASCGGAKIFTPVMSPAAPVSEASQDDSAANVYAAGVKIAPDFRDLGRAPGSLRMRLCFVLRFKVVRSFQNRTVSVGSPVGWPLAKALK